MDGDFAGIGVQANAEVRSLLKNLFNELLAGHCN
jgi:hypothetical protein